MAESKHSNDVIPSGPGFYLDLGLAFHFVFFLTSEQYFKSYSLNIFPTKKRGCLSQQSQKSFDGSA